jgi:hypothetical protein
MILPRMHTSQIRRNLSLVGKNEDEGGCRFRTCAIYGRIGQRSIAFAFFIFIHVGISTTGVIEDLLLDECVFGKTLHGQEERRRGISL